MPPRIPALRQLRHIPQKTATRLFYCPSCSLWRVNDTPKHLAKAQSRLGRLHQQRAAASHLASTTAINVPKDVDLEVKQLYDALSDLKSHAANYVNLSRLQLALRGLENRDAVVRLAVLGLNDQSSARRLVRLLLADPLAAEGDWEKELEKIHREDGRGLLIRYGETMGLSTHPLLPTLFIPSRILKSRRLEILISAVNTNVTRSTVNEDDVRPAEAILVPSLQTPSSSTGRFSTVTYPVHKALLFGNGVDSCIAYGRFTAGHGNGESVPNDMVKVVLGLSAAEKAAAEASSETVQVIDLDMATSALSKFRESVSNATFFEERWFRSGMPSLEKWFSEEKPGYSSSSEALRPAVRNLINSILDDTAERITHADTARLQEIRTSGVDEDKRQAIDKAVKGWAEYSHTELRDQMDLAFNSKRWRKLSWWRLFWKVDDVGVIGAEILERRWLVEAEKGIIWLAGRIVEAGFFPDRPASLPPTSPSSSTSTSPTTTSTTPANKPYSSAALSESESELPDEDDSDTTTTTHPSARPYGSTPPAPRLSDLVDRPNAAAAAIDADDARYAWGSLPVPTLQPWPIHIPLSRSHLVASTVPSLQAQAQRLVLQTVSTTGLASAISALTYVSFTTTSVYEAGTIAALGLVWSLKRLQTKWEAARRFWEAEVREEGRRVLRETEGRISTIVRDAGRPETDELGIKERKEARDAVEKASRELKKLDKS
ncbi:hypothetical protein L228DRAFT_250090 [Xylona heveae TC161]|uniref:Mmc1 C-terminal domain-containing protein n=1 Tax=Xylona heveae (strain CBS 132557 / TC161) TaxID=1328760 RepID=A0A165AFU3_XYLHT|nr:hypothetical protein L228DRAFT_250090 [Xylona heveae TC161]KZF20405.1 hypothetical protein L228DRAFT_250090 [Xylona heveae TC161]